MQLCIYVNQYFGVQISTGQKFMRLSISAPPGQQTCSEYTDWTLLVGKREDKEED